MTTMTMEGFRREVTQRRGARRRGAPQYPIELVGFAVQHAQAARSRAQLACSGDRAGAGEHDTGHVAEALGRSVAGTLARSGGERTIGRSIHPITRCGGHDVERTRGSWAERCRSCSPAASAAMIGVSRAMRVWAYTSPVDMRKGYEGLSAIVRNELKGDIMAGELYLFTNSRRSRAKVLLFDGTGLTIYMKRLDKGQFAKLWAAGDSALPMTMSELALFIEGSEYIGRRPLSPSAITPEELAPKITV